jgi:hypothetical protein
MNTKMPKETSCSEPHHQHYYIPEETIKNSTQMQLAYTRF